MFRFAERNSIGKIPPEGGILLRSPEANISYCLQYIVRNISYSQGEYIVFTYYTNFASPCPMKKQAT